MKLKAMGLTALSVIVLMAVLWVYRDMTMGWTFMFIYGVAGALIALLGITIYNWIKK